MALRRWKPFLDAFPLIDTAVEAADADGLLSRDEFRSARSRIVGMLCDDADDDDEKAEALCALLDEAMAGSLATLRAVPVERIALATGGGLAGAVVALTRDHASERVRGLARGWRAGAVAKFARARAEFDRAKADMDVLDGLASTLPSPPQDDKAPAAGSDEKAKKIPTELPRPRKTAVVSTAESNGTFTQEEGSGREHQHGQAVVSEHGSSCGCPSSAEEDAARRQQQRHRGEEDGGHEAQAPGEVPGGRGREAAAHDTGDQATTAHGHHRAKGSATSTRP